MSFLDNVTGSIFNLMNFNDSAREKTQNILLNIERVRHFNDNFGYGNGYESFDVKSKDNVVIGKRVVGGLSNFNSEVDNGFVKGASSPQKFISLVNDAGGTIKPNRFFVQFFCPKGLMDFYLKKGQGGQSNSDKFNFFNLGLICHSASLPQKTIQTYEHKQYGIKYKAPYSVNYDPVVLSYYCLADMDARRLFDTWTRLIVDNLSGTLNFYDEIVTDIKIFLLDPEDKVRYSITLYEAYPISLSNVDLSFASNNNLLSGSVTFSYKKWEEDFIAYDKYFSKRQVYEKNNFDNKAKVPFNVVVGDN